jgi:hypothetical protein
MAKWLIILRSLMRTAETEENRRCVEELMSEYLEEPSSVRLELPSGELILETTIDAADFDDARVRGAELVELFVDMIGQCGMAATGEITLRRPEADEPGEPRQFDVFPSLTVSEIVSD